MKDKCLCLLIGLTLGLSAWSIVGSYDPPDQRPYKKGLINSQFARDHYLKRVAVVDAGGKRFAINGSPDDTAQVVGFDDDEVTIRWPGHIENGVVQSWHYSSVSKGMVMLIGDCDWK